MIEKCQLACIHDYIMSLPEQYNTMLGEGGINLSGGQRQRLAIARALIKDSKIILFDEATSALDNETQFAIQQAINNISKDYTILIISHIISKVINSEKIFVIEDWKLVDQGVNLELLENSKAYKKLYQADLK